LNFYWGIVALLLKRIVLSSIPSWIPSPPHQRQPLTSAEWVSFPCFLWRNRILRGLSVPRGRAAPWGSEWIVRSIVWVLDLVRQNICPCLSVGPQEGQESRALTTKSVVCRPTAWVLLESLLEMQKFRPHPQSTESEFAPVTSFPGDFCASSSPWPKLHPFLGHGLQEGEKSQGLSCPWSPLLFGVRWP